MDIHDQGIIYLSPAEIYEIAEQATGRKPDVRDRHLLRAAAARPMLAAFGEAAYPTLLDKAAALMHALAAHHLFYDGNKRTATQATIRFLTENGLQPVWSDQEVYDFVLEIAQDRHDVESVASWLAQHTIPQPQTRFVTVDELIYINEQLHYEQPVHKILQGKQKVRDMDLLEAAAGRPMQTVFGEDAYPTLEEKAAALLHSIARNHPFADGNKRTATVAAIFMLRVNGLHVHWQAEAALEQILLIAEGKRTPAEFAAWLPTTAAEPMPEQDAEADMQAIAAIMAEHQWLLAELEGR